MTEMRPKQRPAGKATVRDAGLVTRRVVWIRLAMGGCSVALLAGSGCVKKTSDVPKPDFGSMMSKMETDPDARLRELQKESAEFTALVHTLPAATPQEDRDKIRQAFADLTQLLPLVQVGPHGGVFNHQVTVVADTQTLLSGGSSDLSAVPIIDRGLRAVRNALDDAQHSGSIYYEDAALRATLDKLAAKVEDFDNARGALHDMAWADAFNDTSDAISRMAAILADRLSEPATTIPATGPSTAPTEPAPSTARPAIAPTTAPTEPAPVPAPPVATPTTAPAEPGAAPPAAPATAPAEPSAAPAAPATAPAEATPPPAATTAPTSAPSP